MEKESSSGRCGEDAAGPLRGSLRSVAEDSDQALRAPNAGIAERVRTTTAARMLGLRISTISNLMRRGKLIKAGRGYVRLDSVRAYDDEAGIAKARAKLMKELAEQRLKESEAYKLMGDPLPRSKKKRSKVRDEFAVRPSAILNRHRITL